MKITKKVRYTAKPDKLKKFKALLSDMVLPSRQDKGCLKFNIYQYEDKPESFLVIEAWSDEDALENHKASKHYLHFKSNYEDLIECKSTSNLILIGEEEL
jgi:quinol monooxygenase YgiN